MHPFWFCLAVLLACVAAHFICGVDVNSRRARADFNPLSQTTGPEQREARGCSADGRKAEGLGS